MLQSRHWRLLLTRNLKGCRQQMHSELDSCCWEPSSSRLESSFSILVFRSLQEEEETQSHTYTNTHIHTLAYNMTAG